MLIKEKVKQAKQLLRELDVDCWITFVRESGLNGDPVLPFLIPADVTWHSAFIIDKRGGSHAIVGRYDKETVAETQAYAQVVDYVEGVKKPLQDYLQKLNPQSIAVNYSIGSEICDGITHGMYLTLEDILCEIGMADRIMSAERIISALRERKSAYELENIRQAIRVTEEIYTAVSHFLKPGQTEREIAAFMKEKVKNKGLGLAWEETVCPGVFAGPKTAEAHYAPSEQKVEPGMVLNMDFGVKYQDYCSDMQRTFYILKPDENEAPPEVEKGFDTIIRAIEKSRKAMQPGVQGQEIDKLSRQILADNGYDEFPHALGHQVGRFSHDGTALLGPAWEKYAEKPFQKLEKNMVFTIEPRLTVPGRGVVTIEEMVVVTEKGAEYLSHPQKKLILI